MANSKILRKIYYNLSPSQRYLARRIFYLPSDLFGKRDGLTPPKGKIFIGDGDFKEIGDRTLKRFIEYGGLKKSHRVLDIGSGIGRMAIPLTKYLDEKGSYEGFDIVEQGIDWCKKNITPTYKNFKFTHINLLNDLYNLKGNSNKASNFTFPYTDNEFNFSFLTSVFTHMLPNDLKNYLSEINRVLKKNGKCYATFFIIDREKIDTYNNARLKFNHDFNDHFLFDLKVKEANVAYEKKYLLDLIESYFTIDKVIYGHWSPNCTGEDNNYQDIIVFSKK